MCVHSWLYCDIAQVFNVKTLFGSSSARASSAFRAHLVLKAPLRRLGKLLAMVAEWRQLCEDLNEAAFTFGSQHICRYVDHNFCRRITFT